MHPDLQHLIRLQELDLEAQRLRQRAADLPGDRAALDARLASAQARVGGVKERIAANQAARREIEKDLAAVQARLSKFKDQLMEVKTNKEYQAMQTEIGVAEQNVRAQEDRLLDRMEEAEGLAGELKGAEAELAAERAAIDRERTQLDGEERGIEERLALITRERAEVASALQPEALTIYEHVARHRKGQALSEARDGHCSQCHVRLRPQVFNDVRRNDSLIQCESCSRILYFAAAASGAVSGRS